MARALVAVFDAIFLLVIAVIASGIVVAAASNYGESFSLQSQKLLLNYYAKQVVRVLVTASIFREEGTPDYLLSYMKESIASFRDVDTVAQKLSEVVKKAMRPLENRYDYAVVFDTFGTSLEKDVGAIVVFRVGDVDGTCSIKEKKVLEAWFAELPEVYTSSTTVFLRICNPGVGCSYVPTDIRVVIFPRKTVSIPQSC